jgi:hypothetical protein
VKSSALRLTFSSSFELEESSREVEVAEGNTHSGHDPLELVLLLVPKAVLLLFVALVVVVPLGLVAFIGGVELLPLGAIGDEVGGVAALEAAPR